jgi:predicted ATPase
MLKSVTIQNYRSFLNSDAELSPFTLVIGPNGAGKSNFLQLLAGLFSGGDSRSFGGGGLGGGGFFGGGSGNPSENKPLVSEKHFNAKDLTQIITATNHLGREIRIEDGSATGTEINESVRKFSLDPRTIGGSESIQPAAQVNSWGQGAVSVIDGLKTGAREDLFDEIERNLIRFVPSIKKLSTRVSHTGQKELQVTEHGIDTPFPVAMLSEGTKLILLFLTIVFQEQPPQIVLLEDIDRGLHPRLFQRVVEMLQLVVEEKRIQIIATTHNPYLLDEFVGDEQAILIVEKENAESKISSLSNRLSDGETPEDALGAMWFGGFVGGVPETK